MSDYKYKQTKKTTNEYEFEVSVDAKRFSDAKERAYKKLAATVKVPGFREGMAPRKNIEAILGTKIFAQAMDLMVPEIVYEIVATEKLNPITTPVYDIKDLEPDRVDFVFKFTNYPEIKLGDLSKIKTKKPEIKIDEEEIELVIRNVIKTTLPEEKWNKLPAKKSTKKTAAKSKKDDEAEDIKFEITDELVAELGYENEKTVKDMKKLVRERLEEIKKEQSQDEYVANVVKEAVELSKFDMPDIFVDREVEILQNDFQNRLKSLNMDLEDYLVSQGSSLEAKKKEWTEAARERISSDLILLTLSSEHKILPTLEDVEAEIDAITDENLKASYKNENGRNYVRTVMAKQRGIKKLLEIVEGKKSKNVKESD